MGHHFRLATAAALLAASAGIRAEDVPGTPVPRVVTLDEALRAAESIPDVVAARATARVAEAGIRSAKAPGEPSASIGTHSVSAKESLQVTVPFRWGGQRSAAVGEAKAARDASNLRSEAAIATARRACRVAWFTLAANEDRLRAATELVTRSETNRRAVADMLEVQRTSRLEAARATAAAAIATAERAGAEQAVIAASAELRALLGSSDFRLSAGAERPMPPPEGTMEPWLERARAASPDLVVAQAEVRAADAHVERASREKRPSTWLDAGADFNDPTQPGTDLLLGLGITFPTRGRAALEAAHAERDRAAALLELARRRVEADVETAWSAARAARQRFEAVDGVALPAAGEAAELTRIAYREGTLDLFRLLDAERALAQTERDHADAYLQWGAAFADLERLAPQGAP
jgi:cobalt-zinc-cadmium efflux system outer membrane protein